MARARRKTKTIRRTKYTLAQKAMWVAGVLIIASMVIGGIASAFVGTGAPVF